jgi:hypothetical protein
MYGNAHISITSPGASPLKKYKKPIYIACYAQCIYSTVNGGGGWGRHACAKGGGIPTRGQTLWYSRYFKTLWEKIFTDRMLKMWNPERLWHSRYL